MTEPNTERQISRLSENDIDMFEQARIMQSLCTTNQFTQASLAKRLGVSQSYIGNKIRLLQFSLQEQIKISEFSLSERHARALLRAKAPQREKLIATVGNMHLTVAQTEELVEKYAAGKISIVTPPAMHPVPFNADGYVLQMQTGAERLRALGYKTTCLTESGEGWMRITVTIVE